MNKLAVVIGLITFCALGSGIANAIDTKPDADATKMAIGITKAAHPTAKNVGLLKYSKTRKGGMAYLKMKVEYYGALSKNRYTADTMVEMQMPDKKTDPAIITHIDFVDDNNSTPSNHKNLDRIMSDINAKARMAKAD